MEPSVLQIQERLEWDLGLPIDGSQYWPRRDKDTVQTERQACTYLSQWTNG